MTTYFSRVTRLDRATTAGPVLALASVAIPVSADEDLVLSGIAVLRQRGDVRVSMPSYIHPFTRQRADTCVMPPALECAVRNAALAAWRDGEAEPPATAWGVALPERYRARL